MPSVKCVRCGERVKVRDDGQRLRCPECGAKFAPPDEDEEEADDERARPRPKRKPAAKMARGTKITAMIVGSLLLVGLVVLVIALLVRGGKDGATRPRDAAKVTVENFKSVKPGMDLAEVETILGGSRSSSEDDMRDALRKASGGLEGEIDAGFAVVFAQMGEGTNWRKWEGKTVRAWVVFAPTDDGQQRAAFSVALEQAGGKPRRVDGFVTFEGVNNLDQMSDDRKKEDRVRKDAKWVRGAKAREWLLGEWRDDNANGYLFGQNGKLTELGIFGSFPGREPAFRIVDDRYLEIVTPSPFAPMPGQPPPPAWVNTQPSAHRFEYLVNRDELALIDASSQPAFGIRSYYRMPVRAGSVAETKLLAPLLADLKGADPQRRRLAQEKLELIGKGAAIALPTFLEMLRGPDATAFMDAGVLIGGLKDGAATAVPALIGMLRDSNAKRVAATAYALGAIGPPARDALPVLYDLARKLKNGPTRDAVQGAIRALGGIPVG